MKKFAIPILFLALIPLLGFGPAPADDPPPVAKGRGYKPLTPERRKQLHEANQKRHGAHIAMLIKNQEPPPKFDCRDKGWVVPTWDQGSCGSCYLVSTVRTMTCAFVKEGYGKPDGSFALAAQYGMDCHNFGGCGGGNGSEVIDWAKSNGWYAEKYTDLDGKLHNDYPEYVAGSKSCRVPSGAKKWTVADWGFITSDGHFDVAAMKAAMNAHGVLNIALDAGGQFGNGTSTITGMGRSIDHEICAVAYDDNKDGGAVLLSNQWGTGWGDGGYRWCTYGACKNIVDWFWVSATPLPPPPTVAVPNVVGMSVEAASTALTAAHLIPSVQGGTTGNISSEVPAAGTSVATGSTVVINVGPPPPPPPVVLWSAEFKRDWPKGKPFQIPLDIKKGWKLQLIGPAQTTDEPPMGDDPFTPDVPKEAPKPKKETPCCGRSY